MRRRQLVENFRKIALRRLRGMLESRHRFFRRAAYHLQGLGKIFGQRRRQFDPTQRRRAWPGGIQFKNSAAARFQSKTS